MDIAADAFLGRIPGGRMSVASLVGVRIRGIGNRIQEIFQFGANWEEEEEEGRRVFLLTVGGGGRERDEGSRSNTPFVCS